METYLIICWAAVVGMACGAAGLLLEHPLDAIKTYGQAYQRGSSIFQVIREIQTLKGWRGFYAGFLPNMLRVMVKQAYRYPLILTVPAAFSNVTNSGIVISIASGVVIAIIEVWVMVPFERLKVWLVTYQSDKGGVVLFWNTLKGDVWHTLYQGLGATAMRQLISWVTFLVIHDRLIILAKAWNGGDVGFSMMAVLGIAFIEGVCNTVVVQPLDCIKTNLQKISPTRAAGLLSEAIGIYRQHGVWGLYAGWDARLIQYMINAAFMTMAIEGMRL